MKKSLLIFSVMVLVSVCAGSAYSKGSPDQIMINRNGVSLKIADQETLKKFDPWRGQFINWSSGQLSPPDDKGQSYEVLFFMKWPGRRSDYDLGDLKMIYAVKYIADAVMKRLLTPAGDRQSRLTAELWYTALSALETCGLFGE